MFFIRSHYVHSKNNVVNWLVCFVDSRHQDIDVCSLHKKVKSIKVKYWLVKCSLVIIMSSLDTRVVVLLSYLIFTSNIYTL